MPRPKHSGARQGSSTAAAISQSASGTGRRARRRGGNYRTAVFLSENEYVDDYLWLGSDPDTNDFALWAKGTAGELNTASHTLTAGRWAHLRLIKSGTALSFYVGSTLVGSLTQNFSRGSFSRELLGDDNAASWSDHRVSQYRSWSAALTPTELDLEATSPTAVRSANLDADTALTTHTVLTDASGHGRHWTALGTLASFAEPYLWTQRADSISTLDGPTPLNDLCPFAIEISSLPYISPDIASWFATTTGEAAASLTQVRTIWFKWTATFTGGLRVDATSPNTFASVVVYSGSCGALSEVAAEDEAYSPDAFIRSQLWVTVTNGTTYFFRIGGSSLFSGSSANRVGLRLTQEEAPSAAPNDSCSAAVTIPATGGVFRYDITAATYSNPGEPTINGDGDDILEKSIWFKWTAPSSASVQLLGWSQFDAAFGVYTGSCGFLTEVAARSQNGTLTFTPTNGVTYYIQVATYIGADEPTRMYFALRQSPLTAAVVDTPTVVDTRLLLLLDLGQHAEAIGVVEHLKAVISPLSVRRDEAVSVVEALTISNALSVTVNEAITVLDRARYPIQVKPFERVTVGDRVFTPVVDKLTVNKFETISVDESPMNHTTAGSGTNPTPVGVGPAATPVVTNTGDYWLVGI